MTLFRRILTAVLVVLSAGPGSAAAACLDRLGVPEVLLQNSLQVATLNIAHGRKDSHNQLLLRGETIRQNLRDIANLMRRSGADVIALQEADAESAWSGGFNHVTFLAEQSGFGCVIHGRHANSFLFDYGTALVSPHAYTAGFPHHFQRTWPTTRKGFVLASLPWNPGGRLEQALHLKLVSVHLDFSRRSVRRSQVDEMVRVLSSLSGPKVVMGDFNSDWTRKDSSVRRLAEQLDLHPYQPNSDSLATYGDGEARLDWILLSSELQFQAHAVYPDVVSDHMAVAAEIVLVSH